MTQPESVDQNASLQGLLQSDWWRGRSILVTGCSGILGSWLTAELVRLDANVVGLLRDQVPGSLLSLSGALEQIVVVRGDVTDQKLLERVMNEYEVRTVFHLAAQTLVGTANRNPVSTFEANIAGTWALLEAARRTPGIEQVVVAGHDRLCTSLAGKHDQVVVGRVPQDGRGVGGVVGHGPGVAQDRDCFRDLLILDQVAEIRLSQRAFDLGQ